MAKARPLASPAENPTVQAIGPTIGAEILGAGLAGPIDDAVFRVLDAALVEHKMIFFRGRDITSAQQVAFGRLWGELEIHPMRPNLGHLPEIMVLDNHKDNPVLSTDVWHADTTFRARPTKISILRCLVIPERGGDTLFADMCAAFDGLDDKTQAFISGLEAVHDFKNFRALFSESNEDRKSLAEMERRFPNPTHPVVTTHPVSGRKVLFVNPQFTLAIKGMNDGESAALLARLYDQAKVPEYQFRLRWFPHTVAVWDNRSTQHYAANDYYPNRRHMERVAVVGERPAKR